MEISLSENLRNAVPAFKAGIITYNHIEVGPSPQMVKGRLQLFQEALFFDLQEKPISDFTGIREWRNIFKMAGTDPSRYRPSSEALFRRVKKQNYITPIHSAIDLSNFFSLLYEVPIGIYDINKLNGPLTLKIGEKDEEYSGLNGRINNLENMIISADTTGPFGSPFVDSERTKVTEETKDAIQIIYLQPSSSAEEAGKMTKSLMEMFIQVHGGEGSYTILSAD
ncbi:B3/B4 domain-containing protein [Bacillus massiliglaciei]|uniref:B3/B4 domain-containing protein n=1 Tax=Bacillus massiliglaciei TaxID=1816693 RepID=UPI000A789259|nr:phenylalanine--tRNA ligase beta subunit-related protein [Bacillus massiliglaciei]